MSTREHPFNIYEAFSNGLYPDAVAPNVPFMELLHNLIPSDGMARSVFRPSTPIGAVTAWPYPALLRDERETVKVTANGVSVVSEDLGTVTAKTVYQAASPNSTFTITGSGQWTFIAIHGDWFLCNGTCLIFYIRGGGGKVLGVNGVNAIGRVGDRLILSVAIGSWFSGTRWGKVFAAWKRSRPLDLHISAAAGAQMLVYSERGGGAVDIAFHPVLAALGFFGDQVFDDLEEVILDKVEKKNELGVAFLRTPGIPTRILQDGARAIVYGANGISALISDGSAMREDTFPHSFGAKTAGGCDGHHCALLADGSIGLFNDGAFTRLVLNKWIAQCGTPVVISYDPTWRDFWISGPSKAFILNAAGRLGGPIDFLTPSVFRHNGELVAVTTPITGAMTCEFQTTRFDLSSRDSKHAVLVKMQQDGFTKMRARIKTYPTGQGPLQVANPDDVIFLDTGFRDGALYWTGQVASGTEGHIYAAELRYQGEGQRYGRGTSSKPQEA